MKNKILSALSLMFALMMLNAGLNKFLNYIPVPADLPAELVRDNAALMEIVWLMPLIAITEIAGGLLLLFPKTRALGALVVFPIVVGIVLMHVTVAKNQLPLAIFLAVVLGWIMYENRARYRDLFVA